MHVRVTAEDPWFASTVRIAGSLRAPQAGAGDVPYLGNSACMPEYVTLETG